jgi:hypothetical protein
VAYGPRTYSLLKGANDMNNQTAKLIFWGLLLLVLLYGVYKCNELQDEVMAKRKVNKPDVGLGYSKPEPKESEENARN